MKYDTRVGYMTIDILTTELEQIIKDDYKLERWTDLTSHIELYQQYTKYLKG